MEERDETRGGEGVVFASTALVAGTSARRPRAGSLVFVLC